MKPNRFTALAAVVLLSCSAGHGPALDSCGLTDAEIAAITAAAPSTPLVLPGRTPTVLVFSRAWNYKHEAIPWGKKTIEILARRSGAFTPVFTDDVTQFEPGQIETYDAIILNNTNNELFMPEFPDSLSQDALAAALVRDSTLRKSFRDYLYRGGGLAVIHAGVASFRTWPEFGTIVGARFDNHPWVSGSTVTLKKDEPDHPLVAHVPDHFQVTDEIYQMTGSYSRDLCRVLLSLDTSRTDMTVSGIHREDGDFPMSWVKPFGKGRVFYCAFGHQKHIFQDPVILRHLLAGIQYAAGDLICEDRPAGK
ncbi:ThuA domain-containing protein [bacterium]|nr:ThuA domain-containing protein [bacterium]